MPLLRKQPFVKEKPPPYLKPDDEVFHCTITDEIFTDYERFFERIILCNSLVWTCSVTGKPGLTYQEAVECETKGRNQIAAFPSYLQRPLLYLTHHTQRTRLDDVNDDVFQFLRNRYLTGEPVEVIHDGQKKLCKVVKVIVPSQSKKLFENGEKESDSKGTSDSDAVIVLDSSDDENNQPLSALKGSGKESDDEDDKPLSKLKISEENLNKNDLGPEADTLQYVVQETREPNIYIVAASQVSRKKGVYTRDKSRLFLKNHCESEKQNSIWTVKERYVKKFSLNEVNWPDFFDGPKPTFAKSKPGASTMGKGSKAAAKKASAKKSKSHESIIDLTDEDAAIKQAKKQHKQMKKMEKQIKKLKKQESKADKKQKKLQELKAKKEQEKQEKLRRKQEEEEEKERQKKQEAALASLSAAEKAAFREKQRLERLAEKTARLEEAKKVREEERLKKKEERDRERERQKEEKRLREESLKEWSRPREDMECDDLRGLPIGRSITCRVPSSLFGDAMMVVEYLHCFQTLFNMEDEFPDGISIDLLGRALQETDVNGAFSELLRFLLSAIFQLQEEEEEVDEEEDQNAVLHMLGFSGEEDKSSFPALVKQATLAAQTPQQVYGSTLSKLPLDGFTITELLRLHFLSSGARATETNNRFRYQQRGGFCGADDAGLEFTRDHPDILSALSKRSVHDLSIGDKLAVLTALIQQLLTYVACRDVIEDNFEQLRQARNDLRLHQWAGQRRDKEETTFWYKKRLEERSREKEQKKKDKEEQLKRDEQLPADGEKPMDETSAVPAESTSNNNSPADKKQRNAKGPSPSSKSRQSARKKVKEEEEKEIDLDNIDWETLTAEDRQLMKERQEQKEVEILERISTSEHAAAIHPLGRDRTFRRYWVFRSVPGLFVEDEEQHIPDDFLSPVEQKTMLTISGLQKSSPVKQVVVMDTSDLHSGEQASEPQPADQVTKIEVDQSANTSSGNNQENMFQLSYQTVQEQITDRNNLAHRWVFYSTPLEVDTLINSLNTRGIREGPLKQALTENRSRITSRMEECPVEALSMGEDTSATDGVTFHQIKSRNRKIQGQVKGASAAEFIELMLREQMLDFEERVFVGGLGALKVTDRLAWKRAIECGNYSPLCDELRWGEQAIKAEQRAESKRPDSPDDSTPIVVVRDMSSALLQLQQMVEPKYLKPPLGEDEDTKREKIKEALELAFQGLTPRKIHTKVWERGRGNGNTNENSDDDDNEGEDSTDGQSLPITRRSALERWQISLMESESLSRVFLHLTVLEGSVTWDKSALNARCKICRRKGDDEKMLLCDGCNYGYHMYCLKPPVKKLPQGDWYCKLCKPKDITATPRKRRLSALTDQQTIDSDGDNSDDANDSAAAASTDSDSDLDPSSTEEEDDSSSDDSEESDEESSDAEPQEQPTKIKFLKGFGRGRGRRTTDSDRGSSRAGSARSSRSNTPTPSGGGKRGGRVGRPSLEKTLHTRQVTTKGSEKRSRHSIETDQPMSRSRRQNASTGSRLSLDTTTTGRGRGSAVKKGPGRKRKADDEMNGDHDDGASPGGTSKRTSREWDAMKRCEDLVTELTKRDESWPFLKPVSKREAPDYHDIIQNPMDLGTIRTRMNEFSYDCVTSVVTDLRTVFENCHIYNMPTAPEYQAATKLSRHLEKRLKELGLDSIVKAKPSGAGIPGKSPRLGVPKTAATGKSPKLANGDDFSPSTRRTNRRK